MATKRTCYLDAYDADTLPRSEDCVRRGADGSVVFTIMGLKRYRERFARAGIDIRKISTVEQLREAKEKSWGIELGLLIERVRETGRRCGDELEAQYVEAVLCGTEAERRRIEMKLRSRRSSGSSEVVD